MEWHGKLKNFEARADMRQKPPTTAKI